MSVTITLLQGVNVGKNKRISMTDLKEVIARLGGEQVTTVANSGNVVFQHEPVDAEKLRATIEDAVSQHVGMPIPTITRTAAEMQQIVDANPYPDVSDTKCLHVEFLNAATSGALIDLAFGEDHLTINGREIYLHLPHKMSGLTYDAKTLGKRLGSHHTSRNWNTITKLTQLAAEMD